MNRLKLYKESNNKQIHINNGKIRLLWCKDDKPLFGTPYCDANNLPDLIKRHIIKPLKI